MVEGTRIAVVGFGYIGCTIGAVLASRGFHVVGIDVNDRVVAAIESGDTPFNEPGLKDLITDAVRMGRLEATKDHAAIVGTDTVIITVGTPLGDDGTTDLEDIRAVANQIAPYLHSGQLILLKSTVPPRSTSEIVAPILRANADVLIAFCAERLAEGQAIHDLTTVPIVVGGVDEASTRAAAQFWKGVLNVEVIEVSSDRTAEMVKLADNLWIDLNIACANELAKLCDSLEIDVLEVIDAANTLPKVNYNVNILMPSMGVGGYCLTKDPWFVYRLGKSFGMDLRTPRTSREINDGMPAYTVSLIDKLLLEDGRSPDDCRVAVLGIAFKSNTGDCRFTPTKPAIAALAERGYEVVVHDPWVTEEDARLVTPIPLTGSIEAAIDGADCVAFFTGHEEFQKFPLQRIADLTRPGTLIFDGRIFFSREKIREIESLGMRYKGVGR